jgi:hypothetical protein
MPTPQPEPIGYSPGVRVINPNVAARTSWDKLPPATREHLINKYYVDPSGGNLAHVLKIRPGLAEAINQYTPQAFATINPERFKFNMPKQRNQAGQAPSGPRPAPVMGGPSSGGAGQLKPTIPQPGATPMTPKPLQTGSNPAPYSKQGEAMTEKQMFKVAFLSKCIEEGLTLDDIKLRVKQALYFTEKRANTLVELLKTMPVLAAGGAGLAGAGGYYLGNKVIGPGIHEALKKPIPDKEDMLREEIINEYDRQTETIKRQAELARRRRLRDMGISGVTRY